MAKIAKMIAKMQKKADYTCEKRVKKLAGVCEVFEDANKANCEKWRAAMAAKCTGRNTCMIMKESKQG